MKNDEQVASSELRTRLGQLQMINMDRFRHQCLSGSLGRFLRDFSYVVKPRLFQTAVGVKYRSIGFDSKRFEEYVIRDMPFAASGISFSDLLMPPDLLRNRYTVCGQSVFQSPHYHLIEQIVAGKLKPDSDYLNRRRTGTLDARLPADLPLEFLMRKYQLRWADMDRGAAVSIFAVEAKVMNKTAYIIVDGKHRAALIAVYQRPESLLLRVISSQFVRDPFFHKVYSYMLKMDPAEFSINQGMIRVLRNES